MADAIMPIRIIAVIPVTIPITVAVWRSASVAAGADDLAAGSTAAAGSMGEAAVGDEKSFRGSIG
jgi:hypothetical protein